MTGPQITNTLPFRAAVLAGALIAPLWSSAAPVNYTIDPSHTYPSFEADHMGGLSTWRGKFNRSAGTVVLDRAARSGTIAVEVDVGSVDFGHDEMNAQARSSKILDAAKFPEARFNGTFSAFDGDRPTEAKGEFTLHGVTRPMTMKIGQFKCIDHPLEKREACGADVQTSFDRRDFGIDFALDMGFDPKVDLNIQVEALRDPT
ncbi:polyisoprenoid-binding protein [Achromobacter sp. KS-M25]|nr:YceI family protein [Achromobacter aestuarii]MYZ41774.1 polyisoprenoid-binding protein [Achromobacter aestuarii]